MGLMELELARVEHRLRSAETERRNNMARAMRERSGRDGLSGRNGPEWTRSEPAKADWPVATLRLGRFQLALFRTVRLPDAPPGEHSHGTSRLLPG
ncbi:hypothetical protein GD627_11690 [Arthrobacter yangruifuii]|uniref:Uncharacterized protein n=1 Tax=Arthrobacter yangruifuii TaxID=2606616 RepID=A0A5N6MFE5_9MICC|nr:hypothetical protein [Arthrobacter yangruifuii]KAD3514969.1 hypothetical protein GD627_11690 [Arthrobacter yangruifuii]